jgi:hypothetical protein
MHEFLLLAGLGLGVLLLIYGPDAAEKAVGWCVAWCQDMAFGWACRAQRRRRPRAALWVALDRLLTLPKWRRMLHRDPMTIIENAHNHLVRQGLGRHSILIARPLADIFFHAHDQVLAERISRIGDKHA